MQFDCVEMAKLCQIIPPRNILIMFSCILLNRLKENCWTIWSNFLENPISFLVSTLQSRTICNISIKNRQKFLEKSKVSAQRAPLSHWVLNFLFSVCFLEASVQKFRLFWALFCGSIFTVSLSKFTFRIPQNKKQNFRTLPKSPTKKNIKKFLSEIRENLNFFHFFVADEKKIEAFLNYW